MTNSMMPILLLSLCSSPAFLGWSQEARDTEETAADTSNRKNEQGGALEAAVFVLRSLQNWSAPGMTGVDWGSDVSRKSHQEVVITDVIGGVPPHVHIDRIESGVASSHHPKYGLMVSVSLELRILAVDDLLVASTMLESFVEAMDNHNGDLDVQIGATRIDPVTKTLYVSSLSIVLPMASPIQAPEDPGHPMTEIVRRLNSAKEQTSSLRFAGMRQRRKEGVIDQTLELTLGADDERLTSSGCYAFLRALNGDEPRLPIERFSFGRKFAEGKTGWRLSARLLLEREFE